MKKRIVVSIFVVSAFVGGLYYFSSYNNTEKEKIEIKDLNNSEDELVSNLNAQMSNLKAETQVLKNTISIYKEGFFNIKGNNSKDNVQLNLNHMEEELNRLKKEQGLFISKSLPLSQIKEEITESNYLFEIKSERIIKFSIMEVGRWDLNEYEREDIEKTFSKDKAIYEIIPIVDNKKYLNDANELKQLGISRKRAAVAVDILKSLNRENKVFISEEIITSETERGFVIKRINFK